MVRSDIQKHMQVIDSQGEALGVVDHVDDSGLKLARVGSADGQHHHVPLSAVARVDEHVHLNTTGAALGVPITRAPIAPAPAQHDTAAAKSRGILPWILLALALLAALLLFRSCGDKETTPVAVTTGTDNTAPGVSTTSTTVVDMPVEDVALPGGKTVKLAPNTLNYDLQRYLISNEAAPRTFTFEKLNFDTGSAAIRPEDQSTVDNLAQILTAYPKAAVTITGYTDARGTAPANTELGAQRAQAVAAALTAKGVDQGRIKTVTGGESNPADSNATANGQFENRRTELTVTAK